MLSQIRRESFFLLQSAIGSKTPSIYREFLRLESCSKQDLIIYQGRKLRHLLDHAASSIPFYAERIGWNGQGNLDEFPVVGKSDLQTFYLDFMSPSVKAEYVAGNRHGRGYSWLEVKTGGSTGIPTSVVHDREFRDRGRASRLYSQYLCNFPFGTPYFRLWGSMRDINEAKESVGRRVMSSLSSEVLLNAFRMRDEDIVRYINIINESRISHMMAYVDAAYQMARYARSHSRPLRNLRSIMACAGTLSDDIRRELVAAFNCTVHNKYGSRDCGDIACECEKGGLHIFSNNVFVEVVDAAGKIVPPGVVGRVLVTLLGNYSFPLIRYEIGDVATLDPELCTCGRSSPLLKRVEGRAVEFLQGMDGEYVSPVYIRHLIGVVHNPGFIRRFQLVQESLSGFELSLAVDHQATDTAYQSARNIILNDLRAVLGATCAIRVTRLREIPDPPSGKFLYTINKVKSFA